MLLIKKFRQLQSYSAICLTLAVMYCAPMSALAEDQAKPKIAKTAVEIIIKAPKAVVWKRLTDFDGYPKLFPRVKSCQVLKRDSDRVYLESVLKPQLFVRQTTQHTVNDLGGCPNVLRWRMVDGNFKSAIGEWTLSPTEGGKYCKARYVLEIDPGPVIPRPMASMVITMVQKEIMADVKKVIETDYAALSAQTTETARLASQ